jgi:predicted TIM-barrel fold metal-dependent hydrolase
MGEIMQTMQFDRRVVLAAVGAGAVAAVGRVAASQASPVIEWNMHMFSRDVAKFPYAPRATYRPDPATSPPDPLAAYQAHMKEFGIDKAMFVQPEPYGDDHKLVLDCLGRTSPEQFKATSLFYPQDAGAPAKLEMLVKSEPRIVSTRFHLHRNNKGYFDSFTDAGVRTLWKKAADLNLIAELDIGPNYARDAGAAIAAFPGCNVLIDHMANPSTGTPWEYGDVLDLAKYPNVYMKLSGLDYIAHDPPYYESIIPFTKRIIREFGPDRVVWGGGSPRIVDVHMQGYSTADIDKVKGGNFKRMLNW